jgi:hypothetical protein
MGSREAPSDLNLEEVSVEDVVRCEPVRTGIRAAFRGEAGTCMPVLVPAFAALDLQPGFSNDPVQSRPSL